MKLSKSAIAVSFITFILMLFYNVSVGSIGFVDNVITLITLATLLFLAPWARIDDRIFLLATAALVVHNIGTLGDFGLYSISTPLKYDIYVHLFSAFVAAVIVTRIVLREHPENRFWNLVLVVSVVTFLGIGIELLEYSGSHLSVSQGMLNPSDGTNGFNAYIDTIKDLGMNVVGSAIGYFVGKKYFNNSLKQKRTL